jgi:spoIIIJ-associated protein
LKKKVIVQAKNVDQAIALACQALNVSRDQIEYAVLQQPKRRFWGLLGVQAAKVKVERVIDPLSQAVYFLTQVLSKTKVEAEVEVLSPMHVHRVVTLNLKGDNLGILIGKQGQTLDSLQYLVNIYANKEAKKPIRILLDADGYRKRREKSLILLANRLAEQILRTRKPIVLEPMSSEERKIIHRVMEKEKRLVTHSEGIEPQRHVVIRWKG